MTWCEHLEAASQSPKTRRDGCRGGFLELRPKPKEKSAEIFLVAPGHVRVAL